MCSSEHRRVHGFTWVGGRRGWSEEAILVVGLYLLFVLKLIYFEIFYRLAIKTIELSILVWLFLSNLINLLIHVVGRFERFELGLFVCNRANTCFRGAWCHYCWVIHRRSLKLVGTNNIWGSWLVIYLVTGNNDRRILINLRKAWDTFRRTRFHDDLICSGDSWISSHLNLSWSLGACCSQLRSGLNWDTGVGE